MAASGDWDDWIDNFIEKIGLILDSEGAKCQLRSIITSSKTSENELLYARSVAKTVSGKQLCLDIRKRALESAFPANSIGRIYKAYLVACETSGN